MYIEELKEGVDGDGDVEFSAEFSGEGAVVASNTKRVLVGAGARALFYPTLLYNVVRNKIQTEFRWWDRVDQAHGIDHVVIPTRDYLFAPSNVDISKAVEFIHEKASVGKTTYVHCKAGRGRSTTVVLCYLVKYKHMTPDTAYEYVKSIRPRVRLASSQWQAVQDYYQKNKNITNESESKSKSEFEPFDDASMVLVKKSDLEGYKEGYFGNKILAELCRAQFVSHSQAAMARLSCLWVRYHEPCSLNMVSCCRL